MESMRKYWNLFVFVILGFAANFGNAQTTINATLEHDGLVREYILYVPEMYTGLTDVPLLFNFHGYTSNAFEQMFYGDFRSIADTSGFILVHPMGTLDNLGNTHFNVGWGSSTVDDVGFSAALIDSISSEYTIDAKRIYSTGMSNGGFMSYLLACQLSEKVAAIASVTGSMSPSQFNACDPQRPLPIMEIHGTADGVVPYEGNFIAESIEDVLDFWVGENNCQSIPSIDTLADIDMTDQSEVVHFVYDGGDQGTMVEHFKVLGGGHTWPGNAIGGTGTNYDINASLEIWKFFSRFDIDGEVISGQIEHNDEFTILIFPNPTNGMLQINIDKLDGDYSLRSAAGKLLHKGKILNGKASFSMMNYANGVYFLSIENEVYKVMKVD